MGSQLSRQQLEDERVELIVEIRDDDADDARAIGDETACDGIRPVAEFFRGVEDALARGLGYGSSGCECTTDGRLRDLRESRNVECRHVGAASFHLALTRRACKAPSTRVGIGILCIRMLDSITNDPAPRQCPRWSVSLE